MNISVQEAASLLQVSPEKIREWIRSRSLPSHQFQNQVLLNRAEVLEWATSQGIAISPWLFQEIAEEGVSQLSVARALEAGGIHHGIEGNSKEEILRAVVTRLPLPPEADRVFLADVLLAREAMGSTGVGDGIAIPHVRNPILLDSGKKPLLALCFLSLPVDFGALDRKPVSALFTLVCPSIKIHLHMLSRLAFLLKDREFRDAVVRQETAGRILDLAKKIEEGLDRTQQKKGNL